jgi:hypothetical protein
MDHLAMPNRIAEGSDVPEGKKAPIGRIPGVVVAIAIDRRDVVGPERAFVADLLVRLHACH